MYRLSIFSFFFFLLAITPIFVSAAVFSRDLRLGDMGDDVRALQEILNQRPETQVASFGVGAPGQETLYFGPKTKDAVARCQELYAQKVLTPLGLFAGTGYVGKLTRQTLEESAAPTPLFSGQKIPIAASPQTKAAPLFDPQLSADGAQARNDNNRDAFIAAIRTQVVKEGLSEESLTEIEESIQEQSKLSMVELETTFERGRAEFDEKPRDAERIREDAASLSYNTNNVFARGLREVGRRLTLGLSPVPHKAHAQIGIPVGGQICYVYLCTCSFTWLVLMCRAAHPGLVDYETGTQGYAGYNLPFSLYLKGTAMPVGPVCVSEPEADCAVVIPSTYGILTPVTGSSTI